MILAVLALLVSIYLWSIYRKLTIWSRCGIPTNYQHFLRGLKMASGLVDVATIRETGKVVGVYAGLVPALLIGDVEMAKKVLSSQFQDFVNHNSFQQEDGPMGESVFNLRDERWRETRKIITPTFTASKLRSMQSLMDESCSDLIEQLDLSEGKPVDIKDLICGFTMDVIASTAFGTKVNTAKNPQNEIAVNGRRLLSNDLSFKHIVMMMMPWFSFNVLKLSFTDTAQFFSDVTISILKKRRQDPRLKRQDLIQCLMEAEHVGKRLTDKQIADNGVIFFLAGHDTSSIALIHCLHFLALNPKVQSKLQAEIDELYLSGQEINYDKILELEYLDCVLKETLRLRAPITRAGRVASRDAELGPYKNQNRAHRHISQSDFSLRQAYKLNLNMYLDTLLSVISVLPLVGASLALIIAFYNWCVTKSLSSEGVSAGPRVSVLVPARNEEEYLADCLLSLANQEYDNYEILVMDDASTDKTYEIAQTLSQTYPRITVHQSAKLPDGWFGKSHAVNRLIKKATGDLILMTDADAVHRPNSIGFAVKNMADYDCDFLSGWGRQECASLSAKLLLPIGWIMAAFNPYSSKALPLKSTFAFAVGSYICCKRQALDDIGGMFKVRQSICEDYALANNFRLSGYKTAFVPIVNVMTIGDKYEYNKKIFLRYSRVAAAAMQENFLPSLCILLPLIISVYIVPSISVIGSILTGTDFNMQHVYIQVIILLTYVFYVQIYGGAQNMLLYPFQACYLVGAVLHAMGCRIYGLGTEWKKRKLYVD
ncbi:Cytochrome P450 3A29 [Halotydeus destructor]|nr:Cytochrome P450 3A29 [Halotydeus destructor]